MTKYFSFIIPTFNSSKYIKKTLKSIERQDFNKNQYEIIVADGGSTDATLEIIKSFSERIPIVVINNRKVDAESGKFLAIGKSKGEIVILLDSDNQIIKSNWLSTARHIFDKHPEIWGIESPWIVNRKDPLINQYFAMMKMTDPVARLFRPAREKVVRFKDYDLVTVSASATPVTGANGFFWKKNLIKTNINATKKFEETNYVAYLVMKGNVTFARLKNNGVYHYYCDSITSFVKKRKKIAGKFLARKELHQKTWVDRVGREKFIISVIYNASIIGPAIEAVAQIVRTGNIAWVYHPVTSFITVVTYAYYFMMSKFQNL